jgi:hypothetical protein
VISLSEVVVTPAIFLVVIPAKAGIQAVNDQKPPLAAFDFEKHTCGWLTHGRLLFFVRVYRRQT